MLRLGAARGIMPFSPKLRIITTAEEAEITYIEKVLSYNPIAYWPMNELAGVTANCLVNAAQNGLYTGVVLGQPGIGNGETCPFFDGVNGKLDVYSVTLNGVFDGDEGTLIAWARVNNAAIWTDGQQHVIVEFYCGINDRFSLRKLAANGTLYYRAMSGGNTESVTLGGQATTDWFMTTMTWSLADDEMKAYLNDAQVGATQNGLNPYTGNMSVVTTTIGASNVALRWHGWLDDAVLFNYVLTQPQIADLATV